MSGVFKLTMSGVLWLTMNGFFNLTMSSFLRRTTSGFLRRTTGGVAGFLDCFALLRILIMKIFLLFIPLNLETVKLHFFIRHNTGFAAADVNLLLSRIHSLKVRQQQPLTIISLHDDSVFFRVQVFNILNRFGSS